MKIKRFVVNPLAVNCYVVYQGRRGILIDPGEAAQEVLDFIDSLQLEILAVVNTHAHADHIAGNDWFREKTRAPLWIHEAEEGFLGDAGLNLSSYLRQDLSLAPADRLLKEGDRIVIGKSTLEVLHTPGHSPGSISLYGEEEAVLFSGDTLFKSSVGRWDLPGGDHGALQKSVLRLGRLPLGTKVYPGHGEATTIAEEIKNNPFL
ncbi:MAG TPA: MBL fold metallo-hydrolase [Firmicutes bacterium]|nr:MBL fold metallo-hydrolase [Bacillota bacterium]